MLHVFCGFRVSAGDKKVHCWPFSGQVLHHCCSPWAPLMLTGGFWGTVEGVLCLQGGGLPHPQQTLPGWCVACRGDVEQCFGEPLQWCSWRGTKHDILQEEKGSLPFQAIRRKREQKGAGMPDSPPQKTFSCGPPATPSTGVRVSPSGRVAQCSCRASPEELRIGSTLEEPRTATCRSGFRCGCRLLRITRPAGRGGGNVDHSWTVGCYSLSARTG